MSARPPRVVAVPSDSAAAVPVARAAAEVARDCGRQLALVVPVAGRGPAQLLLPVDTSAALDPVPAGHRPIAGVGGAR